MVFSAFRKSACFLLPLPFLASWYFDETPIFPEFWLIMA
jgi:hypothetical protein